MIIGISGKAQAGKDTVGKYLNLMMQGKVFTEGVGWNVSSPYKSPWEVRKFAGKLKDSIQFKFPTLFQTRLWEDGDPSYRNEFLESLGMTRRELLIREAMSLREICPHYWVVALLNEYQLQTLKWDSQGNSLQDGMPNWIITDLRFPNEFKAIKKLGGICIRVERPNIPIIDSISETSLDEGVEFDYIINNDADEVMLINKIESVHKSILKTI